VLCGRSVLWWRHAYHTWPLGESFRRSQGLSGMAGRVS